MEDSRLFQTNLKKFSMILPKVAERLTSESGGSLERCKTREDEWNLRTRGDKPEYFHSNYNAKKEADRWFSSLDTSGEGKVLFVYGVGMGHYYQAAKEWLHADAERYLIFLEDNLAVLHHLFQSDNGKEILDDKQVQLHYFEELSEREGVWDWLSWYFILASMEVSALQFYQHKKPERYKQFRLRVMHDSVRRSNGASEYMRFASGFYKNFYANMTVLPKSRHGNKIFGEFRNVPAIICGAGPSISKHLGQLKELSNKALIFAGSSSLNVLSNHGITPHFGGGIDPNPSQHGRMMKHNFYETPFFYRGRFFYDAQRSLHGPKLFLNGTGGHFMTDYFEEKLGIQGVQLDEGNNVINFLTGVAQVLGCNPIIFVGMDLAYTDMKLYAPGVFADSSVKADEVSSGGGRDNSAFIRKDINGEPVYTLWKWVNEADWIGDYVLSHPTCNFINATEGGIGFPHVKNMTLEQVTQEYLHKDYDLSSRMNMALENARFENVNKENVLEVMKEVHESLCRCRDACLEFIDNYEDMKSELKKSRGAKSGLQEERMKAFEEAMSKEIAFKYFLSVIAAPYGQVLSRGFQQVNYDRELKSELDRSLRKLELNHKKLIFMRDATENNIHALRAFCPEVAECTVS